MFSLSKLSAVSVVSLLSSFALALPAPLEPLATKPAAFFLAGDSTTAVQSAGGGGWGDGFLNTTLKNGATGINFGHNGATTVSFRAGGDWSRVLAAVTNYSSHYVPYVTVQFGHNDQKPTANITIAQFTANMEQFAKDVRSAGGTPILVTSLSRRNFDTSKSPPQVKQDLADVTNATIAAAKAVGSALINLNKASTDYLNDIGPTNAATYNLNPTDFTHLNGNGSIVFGNMVADLIIHELPALKTWVVPEPQIVAAIDSGTYYWPGQ